VASNIDDIISKFFWIFLHMTLLAVLCLLCHFILFIFLKFKAFSCSFVIVSK